MKGDGMISGKNNFLVQGTVVLLIFLLGLGFFLAAQKPLWNDEIFTQANSVDRLTYAGILTGKVPEGNITPLFYLTQKAICDAFGFKLPFVWNGAWTVTDFSAQMIMRVQPNLAMSLAITLVFYFFTKLYSPGAGLYALLVALSSYMVWIYWVDSRPYALWFLLTTAQTLLLLYFLKQKENERLIPWLMAVHLLLSLTAVLSLLQIVAVSLILFLRGCRTWRPYVFLTVVPVALCLFYHSHSPQYSFWFSDSPVQLISASIPKERLALMMGLGGILAFLAFRKKEDASVPVVRRLLGVSGAYFLFVIVIFVESVLLLALFKLKAGAGQEGFPLSNRYFIYLTPVGIVGTALFSVELMRAFSKRIGAQAVLGIVLGLVLLFRMVRTWQLVKGYYHF